MTNKLPAPPMVYISGEEMTREVMKMIVEQWVSPYLDTGAWQHFDLSCKSRDDSNDGVLKAAIDAGSNIGAIFKEPTITPTGDQVKEMGLKNALGSPNGKMRAAWNGYAIDRDTITVKGLESQMGYKNPVLFDRHAVGGEYGAGAKILGAGSVKTIHTDAAGKETIVDERKLTDEKNAVVTYHVPYDNVAQLAHHFFSRSLEAGVMPVVSTKKTVFKWQEEFWQIAKKVFDEHYKDKFNAKGLLKNSGGELRHLLTDDAVMKIAGWKDGGFSMMCLNYDGDIFTDLQAQIYKSPGFISSSLTGVKPDGSKIMEFEASHGTISDQYAKWKAGEETSVNPIGMVYALRGAIDHSANLAEASGKLDKPTAEKIHAFAANMYDAMCEAMASGKGTRDLSGPSGLTTEKFIAEVAGRIKKKM
ncbi:MAG: isocitrate/isopropylmalate family dehydrogenase [Alphaproteobacteria bacterium]|nr:isocitrate/isopropylmalate family dehydrogenase [Alphaproteobacteria bacterium]